MELKEAASVYIALAALVPGFIAYWAYNICLTGSQSEAKVDWLRYLTLSSLNYGVWFWLIYLLVRYDWINTRPKVTAFVLLLIIFVGPIVLGLLLGVAHQRHWIRWACVKLGLKLVHPIPTAWDWYFSQVKDGVWVHITLKDGTTVAGWFSGGSFASSAVSQRDIFVEQLYDVPDDGSPWIQQRSGKGMLIAADEIRFISVTPN